MFLRDIKCLLQERICTYEKKDREGIERERERKPKWNIIMVLGSCKLWQESNNENTSNSLQWTYIYKYFYIQPWWLGGRAVV